MLINLWRDTVKASTVLLRPDRSNSYLRRLAWRGPCHRPAAELPSAMKIVGSRRHIALDVGTS
jgi:hypothetical protein